MDRTLIRHLKSSIFPRTAGVSTSESRNVSLVLNGVGTFHGLTIEQSLLLIQWNNERGSSELPRKG